MLVNLIGNAVHAMDGSGELLLSCEVLSGGWAELRVWDTGTGIEPEVRARLFEPFFTNKPNGTGLGLSISAHIVTQHGGQIEVESAEGAGSTFRVVLPYQPS
jgi:two-component system NtrC family sensor kinase